MSYQVVSSYDVNLKSFVHDKDRGKWSSANDFFFACLGHAFKLDVIFALPTILLRKAGFFSLIPYFFTLVVCIVPIVLIQSFMGQFSSTGFISSFRLAPMFKGIGYVSLVLNFLTLATYSLFGALLLFYFFSTLQPTIPWSCDADYEKFKIHPASVSICTPNYWNTSKLVYVEAPSVDYFKVQITPLGSIGVSWELVLCSFAIWAMVGVVTQRHVQFIGRFLRYSCIAVLIIVALCFLRLIFLPYALSGFTNLIEPSDESMMSFLLAPFIAFAVLGPGWGSILTMASYNKFKTNIFKYSWLLCVAHVVLILVLSFLTIFVTNFIQKDLPNKIRLPFLYAQWLEFLIIPSGLMSLELPHLWTLLFFGMLVLGCLNLMIVQFLSVMTSMFDEFETLRRSKKLVTLSTISILAVVSIVFCTKFGVDLTTLMAQFFVVIQMILNFFMLVAVLWIYGRERFQRDLKFMVGRAYSTCMVYLLRFFTSIVILVALLIVVVFMLNLDWAFGPSASGFIGTFLTIGLLLLIPGYFIFQFFKGHGGCCTRLRNCLRPRDWYPADPFDRQRYEEGFAQLETIHHLAQTTTTVE